MACVCAIVLLIKIATHSIANTARAVSSMPKNKSNKVYKKMK